MKTLFPYQHVGVDYLLANDRAILGDEQGLGKTPQTVAAARADRTIQRVLVIAPASLLINWAREWADVYPDWTGKLEIVSYNKAVDRAEELSGQFWDLVVCDEAHYLKNRDAKRTIATFLIARKATRLWLLTGTPMPNNPSELWTLLRATRPDLIVNPKVPTKSMSFYRFRDEFCHVVDNGYGQEIKGGRNLDKLAGIMAKAMLRRTKAEVLDLPPMFVGRCYVEGKITRELRDLEAEFGDQIRDALARHEAGDTDALRELAPHVAKLRRVIGTVKAPAVAQMVLDRLEATENAPIVVFAHHTEVVETIATILRKAGVSVCTLTGSSSQKQRQDAVDGFQAGVYDVFIGNIQAAGVGITLTRSSYEIFAEEDWVPSNNAQAMARCHRIGTKSAVNVMFCALAGSIDEAIQAAVARKSADISAVLMDDAR